MENDEMSAAESRAKLTQAAKRLVSDWHQAKEVWRDENSAQFEKKYIAPLESNIRAAVMAMEHMAAALDKAQHDCGDSRDFGA
jgi:hypothetical protein